VSEPTKASISREIRSFRFSLGEGQLCCICYATIGIPIFLLCVANISGVLGEMFRFIYGKIICRPCFMWKRRRALARRTELQQQLERGANESQQKLPTKKPDEGAVADLLLDQQRQQRVAVPLTVTMIIIAGYIWIGSALFHNFEGWSMTQAGYFCFITLGKFVC
jgi:potassium channel subfamily K, invertebrate